jgi:hypothetical protein
MPERYEYKGVEVRGSMVGGKMSGGKLEKLLQRGRKGPGWTRDRGPACHLRAAYRLGPSPETRSRWRQVIHNRRSQHRAVVADSEA